MKSVFAGAIALSLTLLGAPPAMAQTGHDLFQQALVKERSDGDLRGAIAIYERIAEEFTSDRALTAKALVQMGQCYEKLGSTEAERAYRRVVREFADQNDLVARAQSRLAAMQRAARAAEPVGITTRQLWLDPLAGKGAFAPTPDGRHLVLVDWKVGDLAIRNLASGESRFLTREATWDDPEQYAWGASVSPDGRTVAYLWAEVGTSSLHLVGVDGSNPRVLYREQGCATWLHGWTHDAGHIVARHDCDGSGQFLLISVEDGSARPIAGAASLKEGVGPLAVSPDDRHAAVGVTVDGDRENHDIWLVALGGSAAVPLIQHPSDDRLLGWVPGTDNVLFLSDRNGRLDLWTVQVKDGDPQSPPRLLRRNMGQAAVGGWEPLGFTRDGSLFYSIYTRWFSTSVAPFDPAKGTAEEGSAVAILGSNFGATWSPEGEHLAFVNEQVRQGGPGGAYRRPLCVRHLATGAERELAPHVQARIPRWSRDGRFILMNGRDETNQEEDYYGGLYLIDVESGEATPVLELEGETETSWWYGISGVSSADGKAIIYSQYYGNLMEGRLVWRELDTGRERLLYRDSLLTTRMLALSPDGGRLVFGVRNSLGGGSVATINNGGRLMILDLEDGAIRTLHAIHEPGDVGSLQWTPDGEHVLYSRTEETEQRQTHIWRVPAEGGTAKRLWSFGEGGFGGGFALSPDGERVAFNVYSQELEVWVMEGLREVLSRQ